MMQIESYRFGEIIINGKTYTQDLIIFPERIRTNWWRKEGHRLHLEDLTEVLEYKPEILIVGTGYDGLMKVPRELIETLEKKGIKVIVKKTKDACNEFNKYIKEKRKVVAAFHLTC
ncbi:MAG: Mth938-like domain-containing protein [Candidatus Njordarchaeia archaeon]